MTNSVLEMEKTLSRKPGQSIVPCEFFNKNDTETYDRFMEQRTSFAAFHDYMFSKTDAEIHQLHQGFKKIYADNKFADDDCVYLDLCLLKDALDYQLGLREGCVDLDTCESIAQSWHHNVALAQAFNEITSERLIERAETIKKH